MVKSPVIRPVRYHDNKIIVLLRLLDIIVIGLTLWSIFALSNQEWDNKQTWWLLIAIVSFGVFSSFNDLYRGSRSMSVATEIRIILTTWFCVLVVLLCVDQASLMIDPIYKMHFWYWNLAVPIESSPGISLFAALPTI
ncbi:MAG: hypothetical protein FJ190_12090 [Gammaproteobacteria bacterium]|nr:hypothetical protein [Gammaproteobacteria bacterium]